MEIYLKLSTLEKEKSSILTKVKFLIGLHRFVLQSSMYTIGKFCIEILKDRIFSLEPIIL